MIAAEQLAQDVGTRKACEVLDLSRASLYRQRARRSKPARDTVLTGHKGGRRSSSRALSFPEREQVRQTLYSERFMDKSPYQVYARLLDDGEYLCSTRTMYRILDDDSASKERRNQLKRLHYAKPELLANGPNEVWSWDTRSRTSMSYRLSGDRKSEARNPKQIINPNLKCQKPFYSCFFWTFVL